MRLILRRLQRGFTLIEALAALSVASVAMVGIASSMNDTIEETRSMTAIQYLSEFNVAAGRFVNLNTATYLNDSSFTSTTVDIAKLKTDGFLTTAFQTSNVYGQTPCLIIRRSGTTLEAMMLTVNPTNSGFTVPKKLYTSIAAKAGIGIASDVATGAILANAQGMGGAWSQALANFRSQSCASTSLNGSTAGRLQFASLLTSNALAVTSAPYLYRGVVSSHPELNQMFADLDFNGGGTKHSINNLEAVNTQSAAIANNATVGGTLGVAGNTTLNNTLNVTGTTTLNSTNVNGPLKATQGATINNVSYLDQLYVYGPTQLGGNVEAYKDLKVGGKSSLYDDLDMNNHSIKNAKVSIKNSFYMKKQRDEDSSSGWLACNGDDIAIAAGVNCRGGGQGSNEDLHRLEPIDGTNAWAYECSSGNPQSDVWMTVLCVR